MTVVIEGTFSEVQARLSALPLLPEARLRVVVDEAEKAEPEEQSLEDFLATAERKNGLIMVPSRRKGIPITTELVKELSEDE